MGHAWLDSLSEDWVSQPGSDAPSPDTNLKPLPKPQTPSRIPRFSPRAKKYQDAVDGNGSPSSVLSERSINERLAALSRRTPSKLSQELSPSGRDCHACRSASVSTTSSVVRHSFLHRKSLSASQSKGKGGGETPEWKRRLVYGDLSYGEQRDLFTSAGTGLENIFKPPQPTPGPSRDGETDASRRNPGPQMDVTLPSSPPMYQRDPSTVEIHVDDAMRDQEEEEQQQCQHRQNRAPTSMRYRRTEESADASRMSELSGGPDHRSHEASGMEQSALSVGTAGESRKVSGRSDVRYEDFSPILLERRQASNGKTTFGPAELPPDELRKRLETLQRSQVYLAGDAAEGSIGNHTRSHQAEATGYFDQSGGFVNFQRGGRSNEGSFRHHLLSSGLNDSSELHPEESLQASTPKQFPTVRIERWDSSENIPADSPDLPRVPDPSPDKQLALPRAGNGSPLKLFQPYDTFTSQTLLRRLSQMHSDAGDDSFSIAVDNSRQPVDTPAWLLPPTAGGDRPSAYANRFGAGELDGYEFNDEFSHLSNEASGVDGDKENRDPDEESILPSHPPIFDLTHDSSPPEAADIMVRRRRQKSVTSGAPRRSGRASLPAYSDLLPVPGQRDASGSEIKRPRTSPAKDPTPKRRRTLHRSDISYGTEDFVSGVDSAQLSHVQMQSGAARSRQNSGANGQDEVAEPEAAASRPGLRPRTPTPSQRSSLQRERLPLAELERSPARSSRHSQAPPAHQETNRKPSIKTEDFINEANKIMAMIRSKAGLPSGLASLEESDEEKGQPSPDLEGSFEESTQERFSRPPSREGRPPLTRMSTKQEDPVLAEQLKKYEEASDMGDILASSLRSAMAAEEERISAAAHQDSEAWTSRRGSDVEVVSDPPNIRISRNPDWQEQQSSNVISEGVPSHGSGNFPTQSTGMSFPTGSSGGSSRSSAEARKTIMPESVSHLIPDQVGNMILDRDRNIWIKRKGSAESRTSFLQSEISEDDPFAGIPDLSVDVTREMQNLFLTGKKELPNLDRLPGAVQISPSKPQRVGSATRAVLDASPVSLPHRHNSDPSRAEDSVEHEISILDDRVKEPRRLTISFSSPVASVIQDVAGLHGMGSEESSILDQAAEMLRRDPPARGRRTVSIHASGKSRSARSRSNSRGPARHLSVKGQALVARPVSRIEERDEEASPDRSQYQEAVSGMELSVLGDQSIVAREEERERRPSLSFLLTTPARARECPVAGVDAAPVISQYVGTFSLSPLSEFTIHRAEETLPLEASYVVDNHRLVTGDPSRRTMAVSTRELVDKLAEVEPFEPYWEDMRELALCDKGLSALHTLDEFCGQLESLDASRNKIRNLGGVPSSVLHLRMAHNQLSSLTAWSHLMNLQHVDVSNNELTSLAPFKNLVHLRSLRADNNQITSLDGIKYHKGLQILRARGNLIEEADFAGSSLHQLTDLDLKNNRIARVAHLARLPALHSLTLDGNLLTSFSLSDDHHPHDDDVHSQDDNTNASPLRYLRLDDNLLSHLSLTHLPHLRLLHADRNRLVRIAGLRTARRLDSLSLREQRAAGDAPLDLPYLLARAYEVRKLYVSGNRLRGGGLRPGVDLLNLQVLEVANCGLVNRAHDDVPGEGEGVVSRGGDAEDEKEEGGLASDLGLAMPNLRVLNLNMNALADLAPLRGIPRLKRLLVAGNRLADPGRVVGGVLAGMEHLNVVDLRDNPLTQGFYAPVQVVVKHKDQERKHQRHGSTSSKEADGEEQQPFGLGNQDVEADARYCNRLDMDTRVRRRLYETLVASRCGRLKTLDGLPVKGRSKRKSVAKEAGIEDRGAEEQEDAVWLAMAEKGLVKGQVRVRVQSRAGEGEGAEAAVVDRSGRWPAEDSFA